LITRALVNVLNNAVKYSPSGSRICCRVASGASGASCTSGALGAVGASSVSGASGESSASSAVHAAPKRVSCTIRDEGYGIPLEQQAGLFERFRRFHEAERPEVSGVGLGMAFVKTVVTRHGGDVYVVSAPGEGTAVTLFLPALDDKATAAAGALV
jgi:signal transduction histidine kinase